jgi:hypothetical protein
LITAYQKWYNIPEWGDELTTKTKYNLPPIYLKAEIRRKKVELKAELGFRRAE